LWKSRDLARHCLGRGARAAGFDDLFAHADTQRFIRRDLAPRQNDFHRPALADQPRQPHGAAIDQRNAPAPAIDAEIGALGHHADIAPQRKLHAAGHGRTLYRGDHRL
jgi:hypothetical protein